MSIQFYRHMENKKEHQIPRIIFWMMFLSNLKILHSPCKHKNRRQQQWENSLQVVEQLW
jgi:hypothetical protein